MQLCKLFLNIYVCLAKAVTPFSLHTNWANPSSLSAGYRASFSKWPPNGHQLARPAAGDINATLVFYLCELKDTSIPQCCRCRCRCWLLAVRVHRAMRWLIKQTKLISENAWKRNAMQICKCWCLIWISNRRAGQIHYSTCCTRQ